MFNNFICEKMSKLKTKGKIVITKKTYYSTPKKPYPVIQPDPTQTKTDQK